MAFRSERKKAYSKQYAKAYPKVQVALRPNEVEILKEIGYTDTGSAAATLRAFSRYCVIHREQVLEFIKQHPELSKL